ncbi:hypothetical protein [Paracoccus sulfuroxidans]|uniref:Uncharacterized protein n=1 Tax=Paracoccus sulfuroxidans TaxID=384678 RepID=A0A562N495_9RHOB|nr:hypothetical protein [Paracoccus sulfuroxidans]TWI27022.1 hypothetical protein IQ24_03990 [Paracoccus sulfuroxidans]
MGRELRLEEPSQRQDAGAKVACITGDCCNPASWPAHWDMACIRCIFCPDDAEVMSRARAHGEFWVYDEIYYDDPYFDGKAWITRRFHGGGFAYDDGNGKKVVGLLRKVDCAAAAETIYHEMWHTAQPDTMTPNEKEFDAYYNTELWTIRKGLSGRNYLRMTDSYGNTLPDRDAITAYVNETYPQAVQPDGWIIDDYIKQPPQTREFNEATGEARWRPSREGDGLYAEAQKVSEANLEAAEFYCE